MNRWSSSRRFCRVAKFATWATFGLVLVSGCGKREAAAPGAAAPAAKVRVSRLVERTFRQSVLVHGTLDPVHHAEICVRVGGPLDAVNFDEGDAVREGVVLFQTDKINLENQVEVAKQELKVAETLVRQAEIEVGVARLQAEKAQTDYQRAKTMIAEQAISQDRYELADLAARRATAGVDQAEAALAHARARHEQAVSNLGIAEKLLGDSQVKANFSGVVAARFKEPGEYADKGKPVLLLEDPELLEFRAALSAEHYAAIRPGETRVAIRSLEGELLAEIPVSYRAPTIAPDSRTFTIKARLPADGPFVSGMLCIGELIIAERTGQGVPDAAVLPRADHRQVVFTIVNGHAKAVAVTTGFNTDGFTEILAADEPLAGLNLVVAGQAFLNDGDPVIATVTKTENTPGIRREKLKAQP